MITKHSQNVNEIPVEISKTGLFDEAMRYWNLGWSIVPMKPNTKIPAIKASRFSNSRPKRRDIKQWFLNDSAFGIGVMLGSVSGPSRQKRWALGCRDFDTHKSYYDWASEHNVLSSQLPTYETRRGFHVLFLYDVNDKALTSNRKKKKWMLPYGELILKGNAPTPLPPSGHPQGGKYKWTIEPGDSVGKVASLVYYGLFSGSVSNSFKRCSDTVTLHIPTQPTQYQEEGRTFKLFKGSGEFDESVAERYLRSTVPTGPDQREKGLWILAMTLKGNELTRTLRVDHLEPLLRWWWRLARPVVQDKEWSLTWGAFERAWGRVKCPSTDGKTLYAAFMRALEAGCPSEAAEMYGKGDNAGIIAALCRELAIDSTEADRSFFLACRSAAGLLGVSHQTVATYLLALKASRHIQLKKQGKTGTASEYIWLHALPVVSQQAPRSTPEQATSEFINAIETLDNPGVNDSNRSDAGDSEAVSEMKGIQ